MRDHPAQLHPGELIIHHDGTIHRVNADGSLTEVGRVDLPAMLDGLRRAVRGER